MDFDIKPVAREELGQYVKALRRVFGDTTGEESVSLEASFLDRAQSRNLAVFDDGRIVGTTSCHAFEMTVPGGCLPLAAVAEVTVQPTHRRRGLMRQMMRRQLDESHERGQPLAALWPSETAIYGRFGYAMAVFQEDWVIERTHTAFQHPPEQRGSIRFVEPDEAPQAFAGAYEQVCSARPGMIARNAMLWEILLLDLEEHRQGVSELYHAIYQADGRPDGYALYRIDRTSHTLGIEELLAATNEAYAALWQFCFGIDLIHTTRAPNQPLDTALPWMLADPHGLRRTTADELWLRIVDARAALSGRRYAQEGRLTLDVWDSFCPWNEGRFELAGGPDGSECNPTSKEPDLSLSIADLAAVYLGGARFGTLTRAGRVQEQTPGAARRADAMFATELQPWCIVHF